MGPDDETSADLYDLLRKVEAVESFLKPRIFGEAISDTPSPTDRHGAPKKPAGKAHYSAEVDIRDVRKLVVAPLEDFGKNAQQNSGIHSESWPVRRSSGALNGVCDAPGSYHGAISSNIAMVAWLADEDPFEVFSLFQTATWQPGWGKRASMTVYTRPSSEAGAVGRDDADINQSLIILNAINEEAVSQSIFFLSIIRFRNDYLHFSSSNLEKRNDIFGDTSVWESLNKKESLKATHLPPNENLKFEYSVNPCFNVLGTVILTNENGGSMEFNKTTPNDGFSKVKNTTAYECYRIFAHKGIKEICDAYKLSLSRDYNSFNLLEHILKSSSGKLKIVGEIHLRLRFFPALNSPIAARCPFKLNSDRAEYTKIDSEVDPRSLTIKIFKMNELSLSQDLVSQLKDMRFSIVALWEAELSIADAKNLSRWRELVLDFSAHGNAQIISQNWRNNTSTISIAVKGNINLPIFPALEPWLYLLVLINAEPYAFVEDFIEVSGIGTGYRAENRFESYAAHSMKLFSEIEDGLDTSSMRNIILGYKSTKQWKTNTKLNTRGSSLESFRDILSDFAANDGTLYVNISMNPVGSVLQGKDEKNSEKSTALQRFKQPILSWKTSKAEEAKKWIFYFEESIASGMLKKRNFIGKYNEKDIFFLPLPPKNSLEGKEKNVDARSIDNGNDDLGEDYVTVVKSYSKRNLETMQILSPRGEGPVYPAFCVAEGAALNKGLAGEWQNIVIKTKNYDFMTVRASRPEFITLFLTPQGYFKATVSANLGSDNSLTDHGGKETLKKMYACTKSHAELKNEVEYIILDQHDGTYIVKYKVNSSGMKSLSICYEGIPIAGSPFDLLIVSGPPCPQSSRIVGDAVSKCIATPLLPNYTKEELKGAQKTTNLLPPKAHVNKFTVVLYDSLGNSLLVGNHLVSAEGKSGANVLGVDDNQDGSYEISYVVLLTTENVNFIYSSNPEDGAAALSNFEQNNNGGVQSSIEKPDEIKHPQIHILINGVEIFGSPLQPYVQNIKEIVDFHKEYQEKNKHNALNYSIINSEDKKEILQNISVNTRSEEELNRLSSVLSMLKEEDARPAKSKSKAFQHIEGEAAAGCDSSATHYNCPEEAGCAKSSAALQSEWLRLRGLRENILKIVGSCEQRELVLKMISDQFIKKMAGYEMEMTTKKAETYDEIRLKEKGLIPVKKMLERQYQDIFLHATRAITKYLDQLRSQEFNNLEELLQTFKHIADELRFLEYKDKAAILDTLMESLCIGLDLKVQGHSLRRKEIELCKKEDAINIRHAMLKKLQANRNKIESYLEKALLEEIPNLQRHAGVQTEDALSLRTGLLGPLIVARAIRYSEFQRSAVSECVKKLWQPPSHFEIHTALTTVLKGSPRLKKCLEEIFLYYSNNCKTSNKQPQTLTENSLVGITRVIFQRICLDMNIFPELLNNEDAEKLFEKFSIEPANSRVTTKGFLRIVPFYLWQSLLRELSYLNLLYIIVNEFLECDEDPVKHLSLANYQLSRLVSFHHLAKFHLSKLYKRLNDNPTFKKNFFTALLPKAKSKKFSDESPNIEEPLASKIPCFSSMIKPEKVDWVENFCGERLPFVILYETDYQLFVELFVHYRNLSMPASEIDSLLAEKSKKTSKKIDGEKGLASEFLNPRTVTNARRQNLHVDNASSYSSGPDSNPASDFSDSSFSRTSDAENIKKAWLRKSKRNKSQRALLSSQKLEQESDIFEIPGGWMSTHRFVLMMQQFSVVPGHLSSDKVYSVANQVISDGPFHIGKAILENQESLLSPTASESNAETSEKGRLGFSSFVEALIQCVCAVTLDSTGADIDLCTSYEEIREVLEKEGKYMVKLLGFNDHFRVEQFLGTKKNSVKT